MPKLWVAVNDEMTCDYCAGMDQTIIPDQASWDVPPGEVHPHCRCTELYISPAEADDVYPAWRDMQDAQYIPEFDYDDTPMAEHTVLLQPEATPVSAGTRLEHRLLSGYFSYI